MTSHEKAILARVPAARFSRHSQRPLADDDRAAPTRARATHFLLHSPHPTH